MIEINAQVQEAFLDELQKIGGIVSGAKNIVGQMGKGLGEIAAGTKNVAGKEVGPLSRLWSGTKGAWEESAKQVGKEGKPLGMLGRISHTAQNDPGAALAIAGGAGAAGAGALYEGGKSRGRHGY